MTPIETEAAPRLAAGTLVVAGIVATGTAVRFALLGQQSLWYDEIQSVARASGQNGERMADLVFNAHGALYGLLLRGWMAMFGAGEAQVRALSALVGSAGLVIFHRVALETMGRAPAVLALALVACSPFALWYSQEATSYALCFALGLLAVRAFLTDLEQRTHRSFVVAILTTTLACLANLSGVFLFPLQAVLAVTASGPKRYPVRRLLVLVLLCGVALSPWAVAGARASGTPHLGRPREGSAIAATKGDAPPGLMSIPFAYYVFSLGHSAGPNLEELKRDRLAAVAPHLGYLVPAGVLFAFAIYRGVRHSDRSVARVLIPWAVVPVLLAAGAGMLNLKPPNPRYATLAFAPYMALLTWGVHSMRSGVLRALLFGALLLTMLVSDYQYFANRYYWKPDAREAGRLLTRRCRADDAVVVYALDTPLRHYLPDRVTLLIPAAQDLADPRAVERWLEAHTGGHRRLWVVQYHGWWVDRPDRFVEACRRTMRLEGTWPFEKVPVFLFVRPEGPAIRPGTGDLR